MLTFWNKMLTFWNKMLTFRRKKQISKVFWKWKMKLLQSKLKFLMSIIDVLIRVTCSILHQLYSRLYTIPFNFNFQKLLSYATLPFSFRMCLRQAPPRHGRTLKDHDKKSKKNSITSYNISSQGLTHYQSDIRKNSTSQLKL